LPVPPLGKLAGQRCQHQRHHKGCAVYQTRRMPPDCAVWNCRWLVNDDAAELSRPDRSHYVIDVMPDFVTLQNNDSGEQQHLQVVQIWIDPDYPDAHRDPALRRWLERQGERGIAALIRFNERDAVTLFPPQLSADGEWHEVHGGSVGRTHTLDDLAQALQGDPTIVIDP
jgi:hypothetical protein